MGYKQLWEAQHGNIFFKSVLIDEALITILAGHGLTQSLLHHILTLWMFKFRLAKQRENVFEVTAITIAGYTVKPFVVITYAAFAIVQIIVTFKNRRFHDSLPH